MTWPLRLPESDWPELAGLWRRASGRERVSDLDLLGAVLDDAEVEQALRALACPPAALREAMGAGPADPGDPGDAAWAAAARALGRAAGVSLSRPDRRTRIVDVLLGLLAQEGAAGTLLFDAGVDHLRLARFLAHGRKGLDALHAPQPPLPRPGTDEALADVAVLNDDYTPMEFVTGVLMQALRLGARAARALTLRIHQEGVGRVGPFFRSDAALRAWLVNRAAAAAGHPLLAEVVEAADG